MSSKVPVISVSNLGKRYLAPQIAASKNALVPSLRQRAKEFFPHLLKASEEDYFWAVRNISFELQQGEVLGILGENGSGKSTLLKMLTGITPPTEGTATMRGRVGSLLEVGTGFHPDLTGRENVFLNGGLLGIPRDQIERTLPEIIKFSELQTFIDVPVKRYSSGMYVRLAFAVAALLKSDILILDEVLAVGDSRFRAKTQNKIVEATEAGRTVLFVSHNSRSVAQICTRAIIIHKGQLVFDGDPKQAIEEYHARSYLDDETGELIANPRTRELDRAQRHLPLNANLRHKLRIPSSNYNGPPILQSVSTRSMDGELSSRFSTGDGMIVRIKYANHPNGQKAYFSVLIHNSLQDRVITAHSTHEGVHRDFKDSGYVECRIPAMLIGDGTYSVMLDTGTYDEFTGQLFTMDTVVAATHIRVQTNGFVKGVGLDEFRGSAHRSSWADAESE